MIKECSMKIDPKGKELARHGSPSFPCACYHTTSRQGDVSWHWHEEMEVIYMNKGSVQCAVGDRRFLLCEGDAVFINSGIPHALFQRRGDSYDEHDIVFHPRLIYGEMGSVYYEKYLLPLLRCSALPGQKLSAEIPWQKEAAFQIRRAVSCFLEEESLPEFVVRDALSALCGLLWKEHQDKIRGYREIDNPKQGQL